MAKIVTSQKSTENHKKGLVQVHEWSGEVWSDHSSAFSYALFSYLELFEKWTSFRLTFYSVDSEHLRSISIKTKNET